MIVLQSVKQAIDYTFLPIEFVLTAFLKYVLPAISYKLTQQLAVFAMIVDSIRLDQNANVVCFASSFCSVLFCSQRAPPPLRTVYGSGMVVGRLRDIAPNQIRKKTKTHGTTIYYTRQCTYLLPTSTIGSTGNSFVCSFL